MQIVNFSLSANLHSLWLPAQTCSCFWMITIKSGIRKRGLMPVALIFWQRIYKESLFSEAQYFADNTRSYALINQLLIFKFPKNGKSAISMPHSFNQYPMQNSSVITLLKDEIDRFVKQITQLSFRWRSKPGFSSYKSIWRLWDWPRLSHWSASSDRASWIIGWRNWRVVPLCGWERLSSLQGRNLSEKD